MGVLEVADAGGVVYGAAVELMVIKTQKKKLKTHHSLLNQWSPFNIRGNIGSQRINHFIFPPADFVPLSCIHQSCQLIPCFGEGDVPAEWRSEMVLDQCDRFWLNNWATLKYAYQSLY